MERRSRIQEIKKEIVVPLVLSVEAQIVCHMPGPVKNESLLFWPGIRLTIERHKETIPDHKGAQ